MTATYDNTPRLQFHNNHVVDCPKCDNTVLIKIGTRNYSNSVNKQWFKCISCSFQFACCTNRRSYLRDARVSMITNKIKKYTALISKLEDSIKHYYH